MLGKGTLKLTSNLRTILLFLFYLCVAFIPLSVELEIGKSNIHITYPIEIFMVLICLLLPVYVLLAKPQITVNFLDLILISFFTAIIIGAAFSIYPMISIKYSITVIWYFTTGFLLPKLLFLSRKEWQTAIQYFMLGGISLCIWALIQFSSEGISYESSYNVSRPFINQGHTNLSIVLEPLMLICVGVFALSKNKHIRTLALISFVLAYGVIDYSWSRASFITSTGSLLAMIILMAPGIKKKAKGYLYSLTSLYLIAIGLVIFSVFKWKYVDPNWSHYAFILIILYGVCLYFAIKTKHHKQLVLFLLIGVSIPIATRKSYEIIHEHFYRDYSYYDPNDPSTRKGNSIINVMDLEKTEENTSNNERIIRWKNGLKMFKNNPITGIGPGCFPDHQLKYLAEDLVVDKSEISHFKMNIHNIYLAWMTEGGIIWFLSGITLFLFIIYKSLKLLKFQYSLKLPFIKPRNTGIIKRLLLIYFLTFLLHGIFQDFNNEPRVIILFWIALSLLAQVQSAPNQKIRHDNSVKSSL